MQNEVMQLTEQLFKADTKAKNIEDEFNRAENELKIWQKNAHQLYKDKKELMKEKDREMKKIQASLVLFEDSLRQEQKHINHLLDEKNGIIDKQRKEIHIYRSLIINKAKSEISQSSQSGSRTSSRHNGKPPLSSVQEIDCNAQQTDNCSEAQTNGGIYHLDHSTSDHEDKQSKDNNNISYYKGSNSVGVNKIFLNHRSVTRPKDVKNKRYNKERSRSIDSSEIGQQNNSTVHWTHPYV